MRFWDTSAIVPLLVKEDRTAAVQALYRSDPEVLVWALTDLEVLSGLSRRRREGSLSEKDFDAASLRLESLLAAWHEVKNLKAVRLRARRLLRSHPLRAGDAIQLAAPLVALKDEVEGFEFLTFDERLGRAARAEGFRLPL